MVIIWPIHLDASTDSSPRLPWPWRREAAVVEMGSAAFAGAESELGRGPGPEMVGWMGTLW